MIDTNWMEEMDALGGLRYSAPRNGMLVCDDEIKGLVFYQSPPKLELLATLKVAAKLISIEMAQEDWTKIDGENDPWVGLKRIETWQKNFKNRREITQHLPIPSKFHKQIFNHAEIMINHIFDWIFHHMNLIGIMNFELIPRVADEFLLDFAWNWNGGVNHVSTAKNLIYGGKLSEPDRFKMMCAYCMEFEVENMFESFDWVRNCMNDERFNRNDHVFYWYCQINGFTPVVSDEDDTPFEKFMLESSLGAFNLLALDFYFVMMKFKNQEEICFDYFLNKMMRLHSFHLKYLIMRMTPNQQNKLFKLKGLCVMERFIADSCPHFALQFWNHLKNLISGDQFVQLMRTIILRIGERSEYDSEDDDLMIQYKNLGWWEDLAMDLWKNTPQHLKQFAFQHQDGQFIFEWNRWFGKFFGRYGCDTWRDGTLLLHILSDADSKFKKKFWLQEWTRLVHGIRPGFLRRFMFNCLSDLYEIREFERKILTSDAMIQYLMRYFRGFDSRMIDNLNQFFDALAADSNLRKETKTRLVNELVEIPYNLCRSDFADNIALFDGLVEFLRDIDQETKINLICRLFDILVTKSSVEPFYYLTPCLVFDNVMMVAERLCDHTQMQVITKKTPSRGKFVAMVELAAENFEASLVMRKNCLYDKLL